MPAGLNARFYPTPRHGCKVADKITSIFGTSQAGYSLGMVVRNFKNITDDMEMRGGPPLEACLFVTADLSSHINPPNSLLDGGQRNTGVEEIFMKSNLRRFGIP
jgi:hypothetical protein